MNLFLQFTYYCFHFIYLRLYRNRIKGQHATIETTLSVYLSQKYTQSCFDVNGLHPRSVNSKNLVMPSYRRSQRMPTNANARS